jgi:hypothetical protein
MYNKTPPLFRRKEMVTTVKMQKKSLNSPDESVHLKKAR